ncbi:hypothetical protein GC170_21485 [bacterium]|nr:hypothetical protein [bacterium]
MKSDNDRSPSSSPTELAQNNKRIRMEHDRHSRSHLSFQKAAAIAFVVAGALVIIMALYSIRIAANRPPGSKKNSAPVMIAVLGVFVSLAGSAFFAGAGQTRKRIETVESLLRAGKSDAEIATELGLRQDTIALVRSKMPS